MPQNTYDAEASGNMSSRQITHGNVEPGSDLENASIASGIPPASLDIYYDDNDPTKHQHNHAQSSPVDGA